MQFWLCWGKPTLSTWIPTPSSKLRISCSWTREPPFYPKLSSRPNGDSSRTSSTSTRSSTLAPSRKQFLKMRTNQLLRSHRPKKTKPQLQRSRLSARNQNKKQQPRNRKRSQLLKLTIWRSKEMQRRKWSLILRRSRSRNLLMPARRMRRQPRRRRQRKRRLRRKSRKKLRKRLRPRPSQRNLMMASATSTNTVRRLLRARASLQLQNLRSKVWSIKNSSSEKKRLSRRKKDLKPSLRLSLGKLPTNLLRIPLTRLLPLLRPSHSTIRNQPKPSLKRRIHTAQMKSIITSQK